MIPEARANIARALLDNAFMIERESPGRKLFGLFSYIPK